MNTPYPTRLNRRLILIALCLFTLPALGATQTGITLTHPWIRWLPGDLPLGGYVELVNHDARAHRLIGADSPAFTRIGLHRSISTQGNAHMVPVKTLTIPPHARQALAPGGYHLMLMHATRPLHIGEQVLIHLHFADGQTRSARFAVRPPGSHE